ncbi:MAG: Uma2 family endonuclease [Cytophagales bacterium]
MEIRTIEITDYELERGKPLPSFEHSAVEGNLIFTLKTLYKDKFNVHPELSLDLEGEFLTPDISILPKLSVDFSKVHIKYTKAPIAVIEILSPTQALADLFVKMHRYIDLGVKSVWIIEPMSKTVWVFNSKKEQTTFIGDKISDAETGIAIEMNDIFN